MSQANDPFRFRLASLLIGTAMVAFVVYATVQPSVWAASFGFTVAIVVLSVTLVRAMVSNGLRRRYLLTFGLAGAAYLSVLYLPVIDERIGARLLPAIGFAHMEGMLLESDPSSRDQRMRRIMIQRDLAQGFVYGEFPPRYRKPSQNEWSILPQETWAGRAFHSMFAIVCGFIVGWVVMLPARGEFKDDTSARGVVE
jgi:hypothetical protein